MSVTTAAGAIEALSALGADSAVELTVTGVKADRRDTRILALADPARKFFRDQGKALAATLANQDAVSYDATYKPEREHEFEYATLTAFPQVRAAIDDATPTTGLTGFDPGDDAFKKTLAYSTTILSKDGRRAYLFRRFTKTNELRQKKGIDLLLKDGRFTTPDELLFHFDGGADCIAVDQVLLVVAKFSFRQVFDAMDPVFAQAAKAADAIQEKIPIANFDAFKAACKKQGALADKVISVTNQPYFNQLTIEAIEQTNADFKIGVPIVTRDGRKMLEFRAEPAERFKLLRLLDDDALTSTMTKRRYLVNSKRAR